MSRRGRDEEIRALAEELRALMERARPIVDKLTSPVPAAEKLAGPVARDGPRAGEEPDES